MTCYGNKSVDGKPFKQITTDDLCLWCRQSLCFVGEKREKKDGNISKVYCFLSLTYCMRESANIFQKLFGK